MADEETTKPTRQSKSKRGPSGEEVEILVETGLDQSLEYTTPVDASAFDSRSEKSKHKATDLREVPREAWYEDGERPNVRQLANMRRMDGQARALYRLFVLPLRAALEGATFVADEDGEEEAEFMIDALMTPSENGGMTVTFSRFMAQMLLAIFDGYAAFEKVFWIPDHGPLKGKVTLRKLGYRPPETVTFLVDKNGGFAGFRQKSRYGVEETNVVVPSPYAFYYAAQEEERKFYGVSYFESAFYHYDKKVRLYYTAHLAAQRAAIATRLGTEPKNAGKEARRQFRQQLADLSLAQWMAMPDGYKVEALREGGSFDFMNYINHHNNQMSKSILAGFFDKDTGAGKNDGAFVNFVTPGQDMFMLMLRAIQREIADQINHYIVPQLIDLNFKDGKYPKFKWGELTDEQNEAIANTFDKLVTNPQNITPQFVREVEKKVAEKFGLEIDYDSLPEPGQNLAGSLTPEDAMGGAPQVDEEGNPIASEGDLTLDTSPVDEMTAEFEEALLGVRDGVVAATLPAIPEEYQDVLDLATTVYLAADDAVTSTMDDIISLSGGEARVRTQAGAVRYGKPIGYPISGGDGDHDTEGRPMTYERLRSLQRQFAAAHRFGNISAMRHIQRAFRAAVTEFSVGKSKAEMKNILNSLNSKKALQALNPLNTDTSQEKDITET
jgi:hypothetical protein